MIAISISRIIDGKTKTIGEKSWSISECKHIDWNIKELSLKATFDSENKKININLIANEQSYLSIYTAVDPITTILMKDLLSNEWIELVVSLQ